MLARSDVFISAAGGESVADECLACDVLDGKIEVPGRVIYEDEWWRVDHSTSPVLLAGFVIIKPRRHVEQIGELTVEEAAAFGPLLTRTTRAVQEVLAAEKVYVCSFGEAVRHLHYYIVPRLPEMPATGPELILQMFRERTWATTDEAAVAVADRVRAALG